MFCQILLYRHAVHVRNSEARNTATGEHKNVIFLAEIASTIYHTVMNPIASQKAFDYAFLEIIQTLEDYSNSQFEITSL